VMEGVGVDIRVDQTITRRRRVVNDDAV